MTPLLAEIRSKPRPPLPALAKATREAAGVSQERLAEELHVHRVTVARWETKSIRTHETSCSRITSSSLPSYAR